MNFPNTIKLFFELLFLRYVNYEKQQINSLWMFSQIKAFGCFWDCNFFLQIEIVTFLLIKDVHNTSLVTREAI